MRDDGKLQQYNPRQLDLINGVLTEELESLRSKVIMRLAKEFNIFDAPDTLSNVKKLVEPDIVYAALVDHTQRTFPVITLCGSLSKVPHELWIAKAKELSLDQWVVQTVTVWDMYAELHDGYAKTRKIKEALDGAHKQKIRMSNAIYVLNLDGYIGSSTKSEIAYAKSLGKQVIYLEPVK